MRLGRTAFWQLAVLNLAVAAALVALLPAGISQPLPPMHGFVLPPLPLKWVMAYLACLPIPWLGAQRLHDVGKTGWHAWMPLIAFACVTFVPDLLRPLLRETVIRAQGHPGIVRDRYMGMAVLIAVWLAMLLLAAGSLRTVFLWLQRGDTQDNRYGPAPQTSAPLTPAPPAAAPKGWLAGQLGRRPFLALLVANVALVYGVRYLMNVIPALKPTSAILPLLLDIALYLPAFIAAVPRLHDRGQSGFLPPLVLAASVAAAIVERFLNQSQTNLVNIAVDVATIYLLFQYWQPGEADANRYGPPPGEKPAPRDPDPAPERIGAPPARQAMTRPVTQRSFGKRGL